MLNPSSLRPPTLTNVEVRLSPEGIALFGSITTKEPDRSLGTFFRTVHDAALKSGLPELRVDVRGLSFVNSSAIRLFIDWVIWVSQPDSHLVPLAIPPQPERDLATGELPRHRTARRTARGHRRWPIARHARRRSLRARRGNRDSTPGCSPPPITRGRPPNARALRRNGTRLVKTCSCG